MPTLVQSKSAAATSLTLTSNTTAGNCLVVCITNIGGGTAATVTGCTIGGSASNFAQLVTAGNTGAATKAQVWIWACPNCPGGQTAVAVQGSNFAAGGGAVGIEVYEVSGLAATIAALLDKSSTGNAATGTAWSSGASGATTNAAEFIAGCAAELGTMTGPGAPWTNTGIATGLIAGEQISSSTGTFTYNGTCSASGPWAAAVVTLNPGVATPSPFTPPPRPIRGVPAARRGTSASSAGAPVIIVIPTPSPFRPPSSAPRGATSARRGRAASSAGAPVAPTPSPFKPPARGAPRGRPGARRGRTRTGLASPGAPVIPGPTPKVLLISLASKAGTDDYGTAYPQGLLATAGVIEGPEFIGSNFIINTTGYFQYSGTPAAGNLISSIAQGFGTDGFGNNYVDGTASYSSTLATSLSAGTLTTYSGSLAFGWTPKAIIQTNSFGDLILEAASGRQVITVNNILDSGTGGASFQADVSVNGVNLNVGNGSNAKVNLNPPMATPPNYPLSGSSTTAQIAAFCNAIHDSLANRGMMVL